MPGLDQSRSKTGARHRKNTNSHGWTGGGGGGGNSGGKQGAGSGSGGAGVHRTPWYETFQVHSLEDLSLKRMIDVIGSSSAGRYRTGVVSIVSKETLGQSMREKLVQTILRPRGKPSTPSTETTEPDSTSEHTYENQIQGHVDVNEGLVVLSLESFLDANKLLNLCNRLNKSEHPDRDAHHSMSALMENWPVWNQNLLKALLILFTLSNIIVFYNPEPSIDHELIRLLRLLECQRIKSQRRIRDLLTTIASGQVFSQHWIRNSRICCPRALFVCDTSQLEIPPSSYQAMRTDLEDQISYLLKKTGLLQTLFSLPEDEDFVYLTGKRDWDLVASSDHQQSEANDLESYRASARIASKPTSPHRVEPKTRSATSEQCQQATLSKNRRFGKFVARHILSISNMANLNQDHEGKQSLTGNQSSLVPIIPRFDDFFNVLLRLKCLLFPMVMSSDETQEDSQSRSDWSQPDERRFIDVYDSFNIDAAFSKLHCQKARLAAYEYYTQRFQVNLPDGDSEGDKTHKNLLESAKNLYLTHARGPTKTDNLALLIESCNRHRLEAQASHKLNSTDRRESHTRLYSSRAHKVPAAPLRPLAVTRKSNGSISVASNCQCGHQTNLIIKSSDRKKKLERIDVFQIDS